MTISGGMCSLPPRVFTVTVPFGRQTILVIEAWAKLMRNHASGGSWSALYRITNKKSTGSLANFSLQRKGEENQGLYRGIPLEVSHA